VKLWTKEEYDILLAMKNNNEKLEYMAKKLKRTTASVFYKLHSTGNTKRNKVWTIKEFNLALELYGKGYTYRQIGQKLGRNRNSIQSRFQEHRKSIKQMIEGVN
jgi:hypothetical protein